MGLRVGVDWLVDSFEGEGCTTFGISLGWEEGTLSSTADCRGTLHDSPHANSNVHALLCNTRYAVKHYQEGLLDPEQFVRSP